MIDLDWIETVKEQDEAYLVNGSMSVPIAEGNRHYRDVKVWLETNTAEPMFTVEELAAQETATKVSDAKQYLVSTDFKMTTDYDQDVVDVLVLRAEARALIREFEIK
jgi:hypothetical protein